MLLMPIMITIGLIYIIIFTQLEMIETKIDTKNYTMLSIGKRFWYQTSCRLVMTVAVILNGVNWWCVPYYFPHKIIAWSIGIPLTIISVIVALFGQKYLDRKIHALAQK